MHEPEELSNLWRVRRYKNGYEPYILISRRYMPWYDERFRGYGWDKVRTIPHRCPHYTLRALQGLQLGQGACRPRSLPQP